MDAVHANVNLVVTVTRFDHSDEHPPITRMPVVASPPGIGVSDQSHLYGTAPKYDLEIKKKHCFDKDNA